MFKNIPIIIQHHHTTKFFALIIGYSLWYCVAQYQTVTQTIQVPIMLYDTAYPVSTLEQAQITIQGSRQDMYHINKYNTVINIDGSSLKPGNQEIMLSRENLFLPDSIKLINLIPSHITIHVNTVEKNNE